MAVSTVDEYLSALEKSKLLGSEQLVEARRLAGESSDAAALAKALARENLVSRWQAGTLLALGQRAQLRLGKYKLIQRLGKGGMGTVFLAEHVTMNRRVALKIVPRSIAEDRASLDRFFAEARAIAALDHPNIVRAYSVDNEMDRYFIVMEFADGQDLQRMVEVDGPLDFDQAADYVRQTAEGLAHAHARNLVHCDIKPSNLLVNSQGVIKILDLGLARLKQSDGPRGTAAGEPAFGTVDYMAPEQGLETANFDHRADIYSLGCTLYFLLTGHPPFPDGPIAQRIARHQTQEPRDILLERPETPPALVEVCKRMMAKEPEKRYQSMQEVSAALAPWQRAADAATGVRLPRAVKPVEDSPGPDDWLSFLAVPPTATAATNGAKKPAVAATAAKPAKSSNPVKSARQQKAKAQPTPGVAAAPAGPVTAKLGWFNTTKRKIVGAVVAIALLAAAAAAASLPFLLSHPKPPEQIAVQPKPEENKTVVEPDVGPPPDTSPDKKPDATNAPDKKTPDGKTEAPKRPNDLSEKPKIVPPKPAGTDKPAPKPEIPSPQTPPAANSTAKPVVKPATPDKKPEPPPKPPEPKPVSLDGLLAAVDLPQPGKSGSDAVSLGKIELGPKPALGLQLLGGDTVARGNPKFELQSDGDGTTPGWSVQMVEKNKDAVKIARIWHDDSEWKIQWDAEAKNKATLLRYCELQFSAEKKTHPVALCTTKTVPPLPIDVDAGSVRTRLSRDFPLPDMSVLRLQVLPLDKLTAKHEIKILDTKAHAGRPARGKPVEPVPGTTVSAKGRVFVILTKDRTPRVVLDIEFKANAKDVQLDMQGACEIANNKVSLDWMSLRGAAARVEAWLLVNDSDKNPRKKNMQSQIDLMKATKEHVKALGELAGELNHKASIPFRVYALLGETDSEAAPKVVIFQSGEIEKAKPGVTKKVPNPKGKQPKGQATPEVDDVDLK